MVNELFNETIEDSCPLFYNNKHMFCFKMIYHIVSVNVTIKIHVYQNKYIDVYFLELIK